MKAYIFIIFSLLLWSASGLAQSEKKKIREGNSLFEEGNYSEAEVEYRKSLEAKPNYYKGTFNLGDALYAQDNFEESGKLFDEITKSNVSDQEKSTAYYNLGNSLLKAKKFEESIEAYKGALRKNPSDEQARYNLEYARQMLKQEQQQQQQQQDQKDQKDQKDQDKKDQDQKDQDKKDQDQKDQDQKDQDKKDQDQKDQKDQNQDQKDQQQQQKPQQISKQDAQKMLDALKNDEKSTLQKLQKEKAKAVKGKKSDIDW